MTTTEPNTDWIRRVNEELDSVGQTGEDHAGVLAAVDIRLRRLELAAGLTSTADATPSKVVVPDRQSYRDGLWVGLGCGLALAVAVWSILTTVLS